VAKRDALLAQDARERALAGADPATAPTYAAYAGAITLQRGNIDASLSGVESQLEALRSELALAFEEQKKFEMLEERRVAREAAARERRQAAFLDESALMRAARAG
jgi:flagellar export protein FliJ